MEVNSFRTIILLIIIAVTLMTNEVIAKPPSNELVLPSPSPIKHVKKYSPWMIYAGGFIGAYNADFTYGGNYFSNGPENIVFNSNSFQMSYSIGGQLGVQYHFRSPYFIGFVASAISDMQNGFLSTLLSNSLGALTTVFGINNRFQLNNSFDLAGEVGTDITPHDHIYGKLGASYANFTHRLSTTLNQNFPLPIPFLIRTQTEEFFGWIVGLGLSHDFNKWMNIFAEYDYYNYGTENLNAVDRVLPNIALFQDDRLTQHISIDATAVRVGLNVKLMDTFFPIRHLIQPRPWIAFYVGGFSNVYSANNGYEGTYFSNLSGNQTLSGNAFQTGYSIGGQFGIKYHIRSPYYFGIEFSAMDNEGKALLTQNVHGSTVPDGLGFDINHQFRINYNFDITGVMGADITRRDHAYVKIGASYADFVQHLSTTLEEQFSFPIPFLQQNQKMNFWGWVFGLGLTHDFNRWLNIFAEYDHYNYGGQNLNPLDNIAPSNSGGERDRLIQRIFIRASTVRFGLNVKFMDHFPAMHVFAPQPYWILYFGGLLGYYPVDFRYGGNYFSNIAGGANQIFNNDVFQEGYSLGGQIGIQYHFHTPYSIGIEFSAMSDGNKALLTPALINGDVSASFLAMNVNHAFRIDYNLDIVATLGIDITRRTHLHFKTGASNAEFSHFFSITQVDMFPWPIPIFEQTQLKKIWGWTIGINVNRDVGKWVNVFLEYDHYDYGSQSLNSVDNIAPMITGGQRDRLTQHVSIQADSIRVGLNLKFKI